MSDPITETDMRWVTLKYANGIVNQWHSHLPPARGHIVSLGAFEGAECVGVVILSRPVARMLDDGRTIDVVRLCTNGHPNAASQLLGRARRVARDLGARKLVSYTLATEAGTSYRAAGWTPVARVAAREWKRSKPDRGGGRGRANVVATQAKIRWERSA